MNAYAELGRDDRNCTLITVVNFFIKRLPGIATWITLECRSERLDDPIRMVHRHVKVLQKAVAEAVDPAVDCQLVTASPSILDHGAQRDVAHLLDHVHFTKNVFLLLRRKMIKPFSVTKTDILNMPQPVVRKADTSSVSCSAYAGTSVVTNHHDVFNFKVFHCKLDRRKCIQIRGHNQIRDVSVHEYFARVEAGYLVCGHAAIRASNPHVFRALLTCQSGKESRHPSLCSSGPVSIIGKRIGQVRHSFQSSVGAYRSQRLKALSLGTGGASRAAPGVHRWNFGSGKCARPMREKIISDSRSDVGESGLGGWKMTGSQDRVGGQVESDDERRTICGPLTGIDEQKGE